MRAYLFLVLALAGCGSSSHDAGKPSAGGSGNMASGGSAGADTSSGGMPAATAGAAGTVGAAGTGTTSAGSDSGGPPVMAGNCNALKPVGTWEQIHDDWTYALVADPFDPATLYMGINGKGLLKSMDCGGSWTHINTGENGDQLDKGGIVSVSLDPKQKGVIYIAPIYGAGGLWKSMNGGVDWQQLFPAGSEGQSIVSSGMQIDSVSMDPTNHNHIVIGTHADCTGDYAPTCEAETLDAGATWRFFRTPPGTVDKTANWEEGGGPWVINATTWVYGALHLWLTTNNGADWKQLDPDPAAYFSLNGGEVETHSIPHGSDGSYYLTTGQGIIRSTDEGLSWSLIPNSGGQSVGFVIGDGKMYTSNEWSATYNVADETNPMVWTSFPPADGLPKDQGAPYLEYDSVHHILYSSNFQGGAWRVVVQ
jgi:hypothetical protein